MDHEDIFLFKIAVMLWSTFIIGSVIFYQIDMIDSHENRIYTSYTIGFLGALLLYRGFGRLREMFHEKKKSEVTVVI